MSGGKKSDESIVAVPIEIIVQNEKTQEPLFNAKIKDLITEKEVFTNSEGKAVLDSDGKSHDFIVSLEGYLDKKINVDEGRSLKYIFLSPVLSAVSLEEVVLTGYTKQSKAKVTGAVTSVKTNIIAKMPVASIDQALQGQVPGLYVASPSGQPGSLGRVTIRGIGSIRDNQTNPLYILDGVPISPELFSALNPLDFEEIVVLKDATSTAQYGSRGANGVIQIVSKKGKNNSERKSTFFYQTQLGVSKVNFNKWDMMNSAQRLQFEENLRDPQFPGWQYSRNNPYKTVNGQQVEKTEDDYLRGDKILDRLRSVNTDWRKLLFRTAVTNSHYLSMGGGNKKNNYHTSLSYLAQEGVIPNSGLERYILNSNMNHKSGKFSIGLNLNLLMGNANLSESNFNINQTNPVASLYFALPYERPYGENGELVTGPNRYGSNALSMYNDVSRINKQFQGIVSANLAFDITKKLKITGRLGTTYNQSKYTRMVKPGTYFGSLVETGNMGSIQTRNAQLGSYIANIGVNYKKKWNLHEVEGLLLGEFNKYRLTQDEFTGYGLVPGITSPSGITIGPNLIPQIRGKNTENVLLSQLGLTRYTYDNRFTFSGSIRRDGSSKVPAHNHYRYFYSLGGLWNVKRENFFKDMEKLNLLRLRISHGTTGNELGFSGDFAHRQLYMAGQYNGLSTLTPSAPGNRNYDWELNEISDLGLEFGLFNNRIVGELGIYNRVTRRLFLDRKLSMTSGFSTMVDNLGKIRNRGLELYLSGSVIKNENFTWGMGLNLAYNKNKILDLGGQNEIITDENSIHKVGFPIGQFYMVRWAGVDQETGAPLYYDKNGNVTGEFDQNNAVPVKGSYDPPLKGGLNTTFTYKNFSLNILFTFINGMYRLNTAEFYRNAGSPKYRGYNQSVNMLDTWRKPGDTSVNPGNQYPQYLTDRQIQKADYMKLRNISLNYKLRNLGAITSVVKEINIFAQAQNLFTWTKFNGLDPEDDNNNYEYEYPLPRTISFGFSILF
ncbi:MAG: SusC/RagA family TonB-linked outer membrane protein [Bergeyella sp.]|nr:SusC/RagA family TonB-linked outer membrane protein [Bergeyella sp.]